MSKPKENVNDLFEAIVEHLPHPNVDIGGELKMLVS
jgi:hypothetical protein